jgi:hypothetical protein
MSLRLVNQNKAAGRRGNYCCGEQKGGTFAVGQFLNAIRLVTSSNRFDRSTLIHLQRKTQACCIQYSLETLKRRQVLSRAVPNGESLSGPRVCRIDFLQLLET